MNLIVSSIVGGVNEQNSVVNKCLCRWLLHQKGDYYRPQRSWGKVVYLWFCSQGGVPGPRGCLVPGGAWSGGVWSRGWLVPGGAWSQGGAWSGSLVPGGCLVRGVWRTSHPHPPRWLLLRAVRILLECILVVSNETRDKLRFSWQLNVLSVKIESNYLLIGIILQETNPWRYWSF